MRRTAGSGSLSNYLGRERECPGRRSRRRVGMTVDELERRVVVLEQEVQRLKDEIRASKPSDNRGWLAAIERFAGDEGLLAIFKDAQKLRERERRRARRGILD